MKNYTLKLILRIAILTTVITLTVLAFLDDRLMVNRFILVVILVTVLAELFWFLNYTNRQLRLFIESLKNEDYTVRFADKGDLGVRLLNRSFQEVILRARTRRSSEKSQEQFLEIAFNRLNAGILSLSQSGEIRFMNTKAGDLLGTGRLHSLAALERVLPELAAYIRNGTSEELQLIEIRSGNHPVTLSVRSARMRMESDEYLLLTFQDIREALDQREIDSWNRLIRILTHEIMNSVTPIAALSEAMHQQLLTDGELKARNELDPEQLEDLSFSLQTINRRSEGLLAFVEDYRKFTRIGTPKVTEIPLMEFVHQLAGLFREEINQKNIRLDLDLSPDTVIRADRVQTEQAIINILRNAIDALEDQAESIITVQHQQDDRFDQILITDNGPGIPPEELREVFVPFFTTKKSGSGIGLSLTRQILHAHGGTIDISSTVNKGTTCILFFPGKHHY